MVFSECKKQHHHYFAGNKVPTIAKLQPALHAKRCARFSKKVRNNGGHQTKKRLRRAYWNHLSKSRYKAMIRQQLFNSIFWKAAGTTSIYVQFSNAERRLDHRRLLIYIQEGQLRQERWWGDMPPPAWSVEAFSAMIYLCTKYSCFHTVSEQNLCFRLPYTLRKQ